MTSEAIIAHILTTKLHRPAIDENHVQRPSLLERLDQRRNRPLTLVSAPAGYGKSVLISCWLERCDIPSTWCSLDENDNYLHIFAAYFIAAIEKLFPEAYRNTRALLKAPNPPPMSVLANSLMNELDRIDQSFIIALDDYHLINEAAVNDLIAAMLKHPLLTMHLVIVSRRDPPVSITRLRARSQVTEIRTLDLRFTNAETKMFLERLLGFPIDPSTAAAVGKKTEGWVTGLRLAALSMRHRGDLDPALLAPQVGMQYVTDYLFTEVFSHQPPEISQYLLSTSILDRFCGQLCEAVCVSETEPFTCEIGGWEFIDWLKKENLFLIAMDAENRWFRFHHLFKNLLFNQLKRHFSSQYINALHENASAWFAENGLLEEALQHSMAAGDAEKAASLVADCVERIETLNADYPPEALVNVKYVPGQFEALKGLVHYIASDGKRALALSRRALNKIPLHHKRVRLFADLYQLGAYQMIGKLDTGLSIYQKGMSRYNNRDKDYHAMYLAALGLVYWVDADLMALEQTADSLMELIKESSLPAAISFGLYYLGIIQYHRNELQKAEETLTQSSETHYAYSPMNYAHSIFALALTYQGQGKPDQASKISRSVVHNAIENNNADVLQVARAFEAELALRQGHLTIVSRWMKKYQAKPFVPPFRFYMPQLTAVKILLTQNTTDSQRQADDLLEQLHDYLESIHNNRFRIDVLALQALLHDAQGEKSAAIKKLSQALDLAEPGGIIRLFVDLGPPMAELLKRLIENNVAVKYAGRILTAFREDAQMAVSDAFHHEQSPDHPTALSPGRSASQPLVEPLTNRELEILNLLTQRLRNKEIAAKLFVSPVTIKKHLTSIYGKLNVTGRLQAIEKANALGILTRR